MHQFFSINAQLRTCFGLLTKSNAWMECECSTVRFGTHQKPISKFGGMHLPLALHSGHHHTMLPILLTPLLMQSAISMFSIMKCSLFWPHSSGLPPSAPFPI